MSGLEAVAVPLLIGSTVAGTGLSVAGQQMAGSEAKRSAEFEAQQYEKQSKVYQDQASQDEAARRRDLESSLETIAVMRAGRGLSLDSPTGQAIMGNVLSSGERDIGIARENFEAKSENARLAAQEVRRKGSASLLAADIGSLTTIVSGVGKVATAGRYPYRA